MYIYILAGVVSRTTTAPMRMIYMYVYIYMYVCEYI